jgi:hypothetical protein
MGEPKATNSKTGLIIAITVALIGCLGTIIAALIGILPQVIETSIPPTSTNIISTRPPTNTDPPAIDEITNTNPPPATDVPTSPTLPDTPPDTILEVGRIWREDGLELIVPQMYINTEDPGPGIGLSVRLINQRGQDFVLRYSIENFSASDNLGNQLEVGTYNTFYGYYYEHVGESVGTIEILISPESTYNLAFGVGTIDAFDIPGIEFFVKADIGDTAVTEIIFQVSGISGIDNARWRIPINH